MKTRNYLELSQMKTFEQRYNYLKLNGVVGNTTFGYDRYLNQRLYKSKHWLWTREQVIIRDDGCDLGMPDYKIYDKIIIHHMNPITIEDVEQELDIVFDPWYLICTAHNTHNAIHYGDSSKLSLPFIERKPNDMCPWK